MEYLTKKEAAREMRMGVSTLDRYIARKEIAVRRIGVRVLIHQAEVEKFMRRDHGCAALPRRKNGLIAMASGERPA